VADIVIAPETIAPLEGDVIDTVGGVISVGGVTVKLYVADLFIPPPDAVMVIGYVPIVAVEVVERVNVELQVGAHAVGLKEHDVPEGKLEQENETDWVVPEVRVAAMVVTVD